MTKLAEFLPEEPVLKDLWVAILKSSVNGFIVNALICMLIIVAMIPSVLPFGDLYSWFLETFELDIDADDVSGRFALFAILLFISSLFDVSLSFHRIHDATLDFVERSRVRETIARLAGRFGGVPVDLDGDHRALREWADVALKKTDIEGMKGRMLIIFGLLLYSTAVLTPWVVLWYHLSELHWWVILALLKAPLLFGPVRELVSLAVRRHPQRTVMHEVPAA